MCRRMELAWSERLVCWWFDSAKPARVAGFVVLGRGRGGAQSWLGLAIVTCEQAARDRYDAADDRERIEKKNNAMAK